ncbi:MAG: hypothetical protein Q3997_00200 [Propionibacteriaceae bacterium]|nr:hypothetical protein [Propionibacteriaceae bacterium]
MKIDYLPASPRWTSLKAEVVDFDGLPPVNTLRVDWPYETTSSDRIAVAGALAFSHWSAGRMDFQKPISALTAQRITEWYAVDNVWVSPGPVRTGGLFLPRGSRSACLVLGDVHESLPGALPIAMVGPSTGTAVRPEWVELASNASFFALPGDSSPVLLAALAAVVLSAEQLHINTLSFPKLRAERPDLFDRAARLLECVSLGLVR